MFGSDVQITKISCPYCFESWGCEVIDGRVVKLGCGCGAQVEIKDLTCSEDGGGNVVNLTYFIQEKDYLIRKEKVKNDILYDILL